MKKTIWCLLVLTVFAKVLIFAQEEIPYSMNKSTMFGVGNSDLYDTYLSPLKYKGLSLRIMHEQLQRKKWFNSNFTKQQIFELAYASGENPAKNATEYSLTLDYKLGGHYNLMKTEKFRFGAGGFWNLTGGVLYNQRNSNNPASAILNTNINLSLIAFYDFKNITFRGQLSTPLLGVFFSPHYGQSYYEISLRNSFDVMNFASFHNQRALRSYLSADLPLNKVMLRVGYFGSFYQTKIHGIQTHNYSNSFVIGIVSESINLSGAKIRKNKAIDSSYY